MEKISLENDIENILSGVSKYSEAGLIQTICHYLRRCEKAGEKAQDAEFSKEQEAAELEKYLSEKDFWYKGEIDDEKYIGEGAEQKVYFEPETISVIKFNDSIFYSSWQDYLNNLLLHNYFFPGTAYQLLGFKKMDSTLFAAVKQPFIKSTEPTNLNLVKEFMSQNGFINNKGNDYYNKKLGIIAEDLHDENVLTNNGVLFFIDTVFYLTNTFI